MTETYTIFLATDGRHVVIGSGDEVAASESLLDGMHAAGIQGWLAVLTGKYYGRGKVLLTRGNAVGDAMNLLWDEAVATFVANRKTAVRGWK